MKYILQDLADILKRLRVADLRISEKLEVEVDFYEDSQKKFESLLGYF
jgi:hypothetical protein